MIPSPPRTTRTYTLLPYTTLFRSRSERRVHAHRDASARRRGRRERSQARQDRRARSEEHTSELQSLMRISYAVFCLKKKIAYTVAGSAMSTLFGVGKNAASDGIQWIVHYTDNTTIVMGTAVF